MVSRAVTPTVARDGGRSDWKQSWVLLVIGPGVIARCGSALVQGQLALEPDARESLRLARSFSFLAPWKASLREPLWIAAVKLVASPFGYSPTALRTATTALSIGCLVAAWLLFRRHLSRPVAMLATGILSLHGLVVLSAGRGLREELVLLLVIAGLHGTLSRRPHAITISAVVGALSIVRWEIAILCIALLILATAMRRVPPRVLAGASLAVVVFAGPWLASNASEFGDPLLHSNQHATFWHRVYQRDTAGVDDGLSVTWLEFYAEDLGIGRTIRRAVTGAGGLALDVVADGPQPLSNRWLDRNVAWEIPRRAGRGINVVKPWVAGAVWVAVVIGLFRRRSSWSPLLVVSGVIVVAGWLPYGVLRGLSFFDPRFVVFTVPFAAVLVAEGLLALRASQPSTNQ